MSAIIEAIRRRARNRRKKNQLPPTVVTVLRLVLLSLLIAISLDIILVSIIVIFPSQTVIQFFNIPSQFVSLLDPKLIASEGIVDVFLGVGIAVFLWRILGERIQGIVARADARIKYDHLRIVEHEKNRYVINRKTKRGFLISVLVKDLANEGIIQSIDPNETVISTTSEKEGFLLTEKEPTREELSLGA